MDDWRDHRIDELEGTPVQIELKCGCTRVLYVGEAFLTARLGPQATFADVERRMKCKACGRRPEVRFDLPWAMTGGRDMRPKDQRTPLPGWVRIG